MWQARQFFLIILCTSISLNSCGLAFICLKKPYDPLWGLEHLYLLMEKQRNRGQDGIGIALIKPQQEYISVKRIRSCKPHALEAVYQSLVGVIDQSIADVPIFMGHVRYGTFAGTGKGYCQPILHKQEDGKIAQVFAGNFNLTNIKDLGNWLIDHDQIDVPESDTGIIAHTLQVLFEQGHTLESALHLLTEMIDGGYVFMATMQDGRTFVYRDPAGIRSAYYYSDEKCSAVASERAALALVFQTDYSKIKEIQPGSALIINPDGFIEIMQITPPTTIRACSFERIYFSRAHDPAIMQERKALGRAVAPRVLEALEEDLSNTIFSYVPNSSEIAFAGMIDEIEQLSHQRVRVEKLLYKDQLLRTFIAHDAIRSAITRSAYDTVQELVQPEDTVVILDDSIVRGTTMKKLVKQLIALNPKKIVIVSAAPPVLYPDCYGIDMSRIESFIAFNAAVKLSQTSEHKICLADMIHQGALQSMQTNNILYEFYRQFSLEELEQTVAHLVRPQDSAWAGEIKVIYQTIDGLHKAIPHHQGDWYFTGNYPTPGGYQVLTQSVLNWYYGINKRAYEERT